MFELTVKETSRKRNYSQNYSILVCKCAYGVGLICGKKIKIILLHCLFNPSLFCTGSASAVCTATASTPTSGATVTVDTMAGSMTAASSW